MAIKLIQHPTGTIGLRAVCDICHQPVRHRGAGVDEAMLVWLPDYKHRNTPLPFQIVHKRRCLDQAERAAGEQLFTQDFDAALYYLAINAGVNWKQAKERAEWGMSL